MRGDGGKVSLLWPWKDTKNTQLLEGDTDSATWTENKHDGVTLIKHIFFLSIKSAGKHNSDLRSLS